MPEETDIAKLLELKAPSFTWPKFLCPHCCAIHYQRPDRGHKRCDNSICHKEFPALWEPEETSHWVEELLSYPNDQSFVDFADPIVQATKLANIKARNDTFQDEYKEYQSYHTMRGQLKGEELKEFLAISGPSSPWHYSLEVLPKSKALFTAIAEAEQFIHILTFGNQVGHGLAAALATAAARGISVRVLSGTPGYANGNKDALKNEAGLNFWYGTHFRRVPKDRENSWAGQPHHKLYVIDGMLAFYGSANSSDWGINGMLPDTLTDDLELYTDMKWIHKKHNELFSFWWAKSTYGAHDWRFMVEPVPPSDD